MSTVLLSSSTNRVISVDKLNIISSVVHTNDLYSYDKKMCVNGSNECVCSIG